MHFRKATISDIEFIITVIINAEKAGTSRCGLFWLYHKTETELFEILKKLLLENLDGTEFNLSNFIIADCENQPVAAFNAWIEKQNEYQLSSTLLKSYLFKQVFDENTWNIFIKNSQELKDFSFERKENCLQFEFAYTIPEFRGKGIMQQIIKEQIKEYKTKNIEVKTAQIQLLANNNKAIKTYQKVGFAIVENKTSSNEFISTHFPDFTKILMEKDLTQY